jgi:demethylphylloquinone reductase
MTDHSPRICILGGGFGGLYTALRLSQLPWTGSEKPDICLVDRHDRFLFSPFLYELMTGELQTWEVAPPFENLLAGTGIRFIQDTVAQIDVPTLTVSLKGGQSLTCDRLVLALGGETPMDRVPGAADHALPFRTIQDAYALEERLRHFETGTTDKIRIAIVGGGYSGVELACKLADRLGDRGRLRLVELGSKILSNSPDFNREAALKALEKRGVWLDLETAVNRIGPDALDLAYKGTVDTLPVEIVIWTVGTRVAEAIQALPLPHNARGQIITTPTLQVADHPNIFALGDLADCTDAAGQVVPATAQSAFQQAEYAGWNIWASLSPTSVGARPLLPFRYVHLGEMMALGTDNATLTGLGFKLDGPLASLARRMAYLYRMPTWEHQLRVGMSWMSQPIVSLLGRL